MIRQHPPARPFARCPAYRRAFELLSQRLEQCLERERRTRQAHWTLIEDKKITEVRLALFGSAP